MGFCSKMELLTRIPALKLDLKFLINYQNLYILSDFFKSFSLSKTKKTLLLNKITPYKNDKTLQPQKVD